MERRRDIGQDGENGDYTGADFGRVTPFSIYCRTMCDQSPDKLSPEQLQKLYDNWRKLQDQFKKYYIDVANKKCGGNWQEEEFNEYTLQKKNLRTQKKYGYSLGADAQVPAAQKCNYEFRLDDLIKKIDSTLIMTAKSTPYDLSRWAHLPVGIPPKF